VVFVVLACAAMFACTACKTDEAKPAPKPAGSSRVAPPPPTVAADAQPGSAAAATRTTGPVDEAQPAIEGATQLQVRTKTDNQVTSIWCVDVTKGRDAVVRVADALRREGWTDVSTRGAAERFGVSAKRGDLHLSATVGGRDEACTGTLVISTIARLGDALVIPPTTEPVR
jgi:hypothetical protein